MRAASIISSGIPRLSPCSTNSTGSGLITASASTINIKGALTFITPDKESSLATVPTESKSPT